MVLSVKKTMALALCVSTLAASEVAQSSALRTHPRRALSGIHHVTQYAPKVVKQATADDVDDGTYDSYDSYDLEDSDSADVELEGSEELDVDSSKSLDMDFSGSGYMDVDLDVGEGLDYSGDGDQSLDMSSSGSLDLSASASLGASGQMETDVDFTDGDVDLDLADDEDYTQELDFEENEIIDEVIDVPEGAKSIHLRVHKGNVDLDIIKGAKTHAKKEAQPEPKKEEEPKKVEAKPEETKEEAKEETVSFAAEAKDWVSENSSKPVFLGSIIGAAVGIVGVAAVAIAKSRKRTSEKSVLAEDVAADAEADAEVDEDAQSESDSDEDSDDDVEAGVTALTEEDAEEEDKKSSVVEGSV